jgi:hypothetical protein
MSKRKKVSNKCFGEANRAKFQRQPILHGDRIEKKTWPNSGQLNFQISLLVPIEFISLITTAS